MEERRGLTCGSYCLGVWPTIGVSSCHFHPLVSREPVHAQTLAKLCPISHAHSYGQEGNGHSQRAHHRDIRGQGVWHQEGRSRNAVNRNDITTNYQSLALKCHKHSVFPHSTKEQTAI